MFFLGGGNLEKLPERQLIKQLFFFFCYKHKMKLKLFIFLYLQKFSNSSLLFCSKNLAVKFPLYWKSAFISLENSCSPCAGGCVSKKGAKLGLSSSGSTQRVQLGFTSQLEMLKGAGSSLLLQG